MAAGPGILVSSLSSLSSCGSPCVVVAETRERLLDECILE